MAIKTKKALALRVLPKSKKITSDFIEIRFKLDDDEDYCNFSTIYSNEDLQIDSSSISCGIKQVSNIEELAKVFNRARNMSKIKAKFDEHALQVLDNAFNEIQEELQNAFLIMSSCLNTVSDKLIAEYLDKICASTEVKTNPNSGNKIKMWIY